jgi:hypothetical protein
MNLGLGLRLRSVVTSSGGAAPSGIPVASTTNLLITLNETTYGNNFVNKAYTKFVYPTAYYCSSDLLPGPELIFDQLDNPNIWSLSQSDGEGGRNVSATNTSTNGDYIPTTGWTGAGLITLTITAA